MLGDTQRMLKVRLRYLCHRYFEGNYESMASALNGIPYPDLPGAVMPRKFELDVANENGWEEARTVISRSRLYKEANTNGVRVKDDVLAALVHIGVSEEWMQTGGEDPVTERFDEALYMSRSVYGASPGDAYLMARRERAGVVWDTAKGMVEPIHSALRTMGVWYTGDKHDLAERVALAIADAEFRHPGDEEAVNDAVERVVLNEPYLGDEQRKLREYVQRGAGRALRVVEP